jgi:RNA polymerase sigma-70 factor, ECF subfamily
VLNEDERVLVNHARAGNEAAFAALFAAYQGPITSYLYRLVHDREVADDLAQETFLKAYAALARTDPQLAFRPWLYRITTNTARNYFRRQRVLRWLPFGASTADLPAMPAPDEQLGERDLLVRALRQIGPAYASALLLHHHLDLPLRETAAALGLSVNGTKVRLFRARKAFVHAYLALSQAEEEVQ